MVESRLALTREWKLECMEMGTEIVSFNHDFHRKATAKLS